MFGDDRNVNRRCFAFCMSIDEAGMMSSSSIDSIPTASTMCTEMNE